MSAAWDVRHSLLINHILDLQPHEMGSNTDDAIATKARMGSVIAIISAPDSEALFRAANNPALSPPG